MSSTELERYLAAFREPSGYLNFASYGPPSQAVVDTIGGLAQAAADGEASALLHAEDRRALAAVSRLSGFAPDAVALTSSTSLGLFQIAFGLPPGEILVSAAEFPSNLYAWWRSEQAGLTRVRTLPPVAGAPLAPVTAARVSEALTADTVAVAVSAVDFRTGARADLAALRDAVGDRLLIVDGIQGFGVIEADWTLADALVVGGQKWLRAGWGTGFLALSPRALDRLRPLLGGWTGVEEAGLYDGRPHPALPGAQRLSITNASPFSSGALATALELLESVGVATVGRRIADRTDQLSIALTDAGFPVLSPREDAARAGIVVAHVADRPAPTLVARLAERGVTATAHGSDRVRFSVHATTSSSAVDAAIDALKGTQ